MLLPAWEDLTSDGIDELVVASDNGGAGSGSITFAVFDLRSKYFIELLRVESMLRFDDCAS
jgi:hypothetical protein